jgi:release factor glutamine methyltransferase
MDYIISQLRGYYPDNELRELAYWIVEETTGMTRTDILIGCKDTKNIPNIEIILEKLRAHEPIQYIFGHTEWMGLDLRVTYDTLIPRPETSELVEWVLQLTDTSKPMKVLDIGTGSGCIALALKKNAPLWSVTGLDISQKALEVAKENAVRNHLQVDWIQADILSPITHIQYPIPNTQSPISNTQYPISHTPYPIPDIIISNPPYICDAEKRDMDARVLDYEPHSALFVPDTDPLLFYRQIASLAFLPVAPVVEPQRSNLRAKPIDIFFEINEAYGNEVCAMMREMGYTHVELKYDMYGKPRMVYATITI